MIKKIIFEKWFFILNKLQKKLIGLTLNLVHDLWYIHFSNVIFRIFIFFCFSYWIITILKSSYNSLLCLSLKLIISNVMKVINDKKNIIKVYHGVVTNALLLE